MTYNAGIPNANDLIANSQGEIKTNFFQLNDQFGKDHVPFNNAGSNGTGFHTKVTLELGSDPAANTTDVILYNKQVNYTGPTTRNELFLRQSSNDGSAVIQLTDLFQAINTGSSGSTFLPGGLAIKWGQFTFSGTSSVQPFVSAFNSTAQVVVLTPFNVAAANSNWYINTWNASSLTISTVASVTSAQFTYIAIGI